MTTITLSELTAVQRETKETPTKVTIFYCHNALADLSFLNENGYIVNGIKLPCSSMIREVHLLRAFEAGADLVVLMACSPSACRYLQGSSRAAKRVARVQKMLDEIGVGGKRLAMFNIAHGDEVVAAGVIRQTIAGLKKTEEPSQFDLSGVTL